MSGSGRSIRTLPVPLPSDGGQRGLWALPEFRTPSQSFFLRVTGKDEEGYRFQRLSSVSYTNIIPGRTTPPPISTPPLWSPEFESTSDLFSPDTDPPAVSMHTAVKGFYMQPAVIGCSVDSDVPYRLRFTRGGLTLGEEKQFQ